MADGTASGSALQSLRRKVGAAWRYLHRRRGRHLHHGTLRWGKTTLLRILLGLETADSGQVSGANGARWAAVFQEDRLLEHLTAEENLHFVLGTHYDATAALALLGELGLGDDLEKPVRDFSGGMKRRTALARALLADFDLLALDEPFAGLDGENRLRAVACIRKYAAGKPVLLVSHDARDAADLDANVVTL